MDRKSWAVLNWRNKVKLKLIEYKGGCCSLCGFKKSIPSCYDFHHRNPSEKSFSISGKSYSLQRLKEEVDKCDIFCRNCHAEIHYMEIQESRLERLSKLCKKTLTEISCPFCQKNFKPKNSRQKFCCKNCYTNQRCKVPQVNKETLLKDIKLFSNVSIGKKYGVSEQAVRKWLKKFGLNRKFL